MFANITNGQTITIHTAKGDHTGTFVSVNSKGANLKIDGKVRSFSIKTITGVTDPNAGGSYTTKQVADMFDMEAKALRVALRHLGLGVGKGRTYGLTNADVATVRAHLATTDA